MRYFFLLLFFCFLSHSLLAQTYKPCGTDEAVRRALQANPALRENQEKLNRFTNAFTESPAKQNAVLVIPVVFHVIHNYGVENISKAQILSAVQVLNQDFRKTNSDTVEIVQQFKPVAADSRIEFRLAQIDPDGNCTDGITRTVSSLTRRADDNVKDLLSWDTRRYLNIWVVGNISFSAGGYAYYPGTAPTEAYEGIVVTHNQCGSIGTSTGNFASRTLTHEVGHYLNLAHTWGSSNDCGETYNCQGDDGVNDTPNTIGNCQTCILTSTSCGVVSNVQNYMDYSTCAKMFTEGQRVRMTAALNSPSGGRDNLTRASNLLATGTSDGFSNQPCVPRADFVAANFMMCEGATVEFSPLTWNADNPALTWSFPGGNPTTSTDFNPTVQYPTAGVYPVSLTSGTTAGTDTRTKNQYIRILSTLAGASGAPFTESFENQNFPYWDWIVNNEDAGVTWTALNGAAATGQRSVKLNNYYNQGDEVDELIMPSLNFQSVVSPFITFKVAHAMKSSGGEDDRLRIYYSTDCGETWKLRYNKSGTALASVSGFVNSPFVPTSAQWRLDTLKSITGMVGKPNVRIRFEFTSGGGNNIYLDDINISGIVGVEEEINKSSIKIFPNPGNGNFTISGIGRTTDDIQIRMYDMLNRLVFIRNISHYNGNDPILVDQTNLLPGIYTLLLQSADAVYSEKIMVGN